jgi:GDP-L-fucose synthase
MNTFVLKYAQKYCKIKKICLVGSGCVYPENSPIPMKEDDLWNGMPESNTRSYGLVKRLLPIQSESYRSQYGLSSIVVLPTNIYGPHDSFSLYYSHVMAALIRKFIDAKKTNAPEVILFGTGMATRDFIYVDDLTLAMIRLMEKYDSSEPVNIASGKEFSINEIANKIRTIIGYEGKIIFDNKYPDGQPRRKFDITRLKNIIGEFPYIDLDEGLKKTIQWYQNTPEELIRS